MLEKNKHTKNQIGPIPILDIFDEYILLISIGSANIIEAIHEPIFSKSGAPTQRPQYNLNDKYKQTTPKYGIISFFNWCKTYVLKLLFSLKHKPEEKKKKTKNHVPVISLNQ